MFEKKIPIKTNIGCIEEEGSIVLLVPRYPTVLGRIAGKILKRSRNIRIKFDELGTAVWKLIDGQRTVKEIGKELEEKFGEEASPLYPRLNEFLTILVKNRFVTMKEYCEVGNVD